MEKDGTKLAAELVGTCVFVFIGAGSIITDKLAGGSVGLVGIGIAHGIALGVMITIFAATSGGHLNPAVTFRIRIARKIPTRFGTRSLSATVPFGTAILDEAMLMLALVLAVFGTAIDPAHAFGPALVPGFWRHHLVYWIGWIGPLTGAAAAGLLYERVIMERR